MHTHNGPRHTNRPQRRPVSSGNNFRAHHLISSIGAIVLVVTLGHWKNALQKADQLTFNIGYTGDE